MSEKAFISPPVCFCRALKARFAAAARSTCRVFRYITAQLVTAITSRMPMTTQPSSVTERKMIPTYPELQVESCSSAPISRPSILSVSSPRAVSMTTGTEDFWRMDFKTSKPSMSGSITSRMIKSQRAAAARSLPILPSRAVVTE
jgi:hypothetical protein